MDFLGDVGQIKALLVCLEIELISKQDRCMVCAEQAIGLKIVLGTPDETPK
jgi:hypothetical protein